MLGREHHEAGCQESILSGEEVQHFHRPMDKLSAQTERRSHLLEDQDINLQLQHIFMPSTIHYFTELQVCKYMLQTRLKNQERCYESYERSSLTFIVQDWFHDLTSSAALKSCQLMKL